MGCGDSLRAALMGLSVVTLLLAACGGGEAPEAGSKSTSSAESASAGSPASLASEAAGALPLPAGDLLVDATAEAGLDFVHFNGMTGELYMAENMGGGGALLDYDGDGDLDLYLVQGALLGPGKEMGDALTPPRHPLPLTDRLYRNDLVVGSVAGAAAGAAPGAATRPRLRFTDVTAEAGLAPAGGYGMGATAGDYDGDGRVDLYRTAFGADQLLRNRGDGRFEEVTAAAGLDGDPAWTVPALFFDFDGDGDLDLFAGRYVEFTFRNHRPCTNRAGAPDYCDPSVYEALPDRLWRNRGDGRFEEVTTAAGLGAAGKALGAVAGDFDGDGRVDLYVANDGTPNFLWRNLGPGDDGVVRFEETALLAGNALNADGAAEASMGVAVADFDGDGAEDLFAAHLTGETHTLYKNAAGGFFEDVSVAAGLGLSSFQATGFGAGALDLDNDGWLDLYVANGAVRRLEEAARAGASWPFQQADQLFRNLGGGRFEDISQRAGAALAVEAVSRGALFGDLDNDGDTDLVVVDNNGPARLLLNRAGQDRPWLGVELLDAAGRVATGARVELRRPGLPPLWRRAARDGSYASSSDPRVLFGLGESPEVEAVRVYWSDGAVEEWSGLESRRYHALQRGTGRSVRSGG